VVAEQENAVEVRDLKRSYGKTDAVDGLSFTVRAGRCYGLFGRNGAGKTTTMKCLLNHLRPRSGSVRVFGMDPAREEVAVKTRMAYVPETVAFYPFMTVRETLDYAASFRSHWSRQVESDLLKRFDLDPSRKVDGLSKGMRAQLALVCAVAPEPELLLLDEPTSGLDPVVRREFVRAVIGAYLDAKPGHRTVLVSTHLISEFEGLIDEFTVVDRGRDRLTLESERARERFKRIRLRFPGAPPEVREPEVRRAERAGREVALTTFDFSEELQARLQALGPEWMEVENLSLEEIFVAVAGREGNHS
jgi:ABC-2 type transport system ATP-binding protein